MTGSTPASGLRVSDADRDAVAAELAEHLRAGRLDLDEFDQRMGRALGARTRGDLDRLLTDLPRPLPPPSPALPRRPGPPFLLLAILISAAGTAILGGLSHPAASWDGDWHQHTVWPFWLLWWLIPLATLTVRRLRTRR